MQESDNTQTDYCMSASDSSLCSTDFTSLSLLLQPQLLLLSFEQRLLPTPPSSVVCIFSVCCFLHPVNVSWFWWSVLEHWEPRKWSFAGGVPFSESSWGNENQKSVTRNHSRTRDSGKRGEKAIFAQDLTIDCFPKSRHLLHWQVISRSANWFPTQHMHVFFLQVMDVYSSRSSTDPTVHFFPKPNFLSLSQSVPFSLSVSF